MTLKDICERFNKLYTGVVSDMLDKKGQKPKPFSCAKGGCVRN